MTVRKLPITIRRAFVAAAGAALLGAAPAWAGGQAISQTAAIAAIPSTLQVSVGGVDADGVLDAQYSGYGRNISPAISWSAPPPRTRALALAIEDPDSPSPQPTVHWVAWNIPPDVSDLHRAVRNMDELERPPGMRQGRNSHGGIGYTGPHPPVGDPAHHYHVQVFALDRRLGLGGGADRDALARALAGHVIARGETVVLFAEAPPRPPRG
ncbi:MAG: YbhB/YbcL family Raf kinase inhibitor-like protein [Caulobacteraceae bacterium]|nr:YbhB/YbcL family Raf kinase inhibitor-like protein [Caulobacter sp.]